MNNIKCPICGEDIKQLGLIVKAIQVLDEDGYEPVEEVVDTIGYFCVNCGNELSEEQAQPIEDYLTKDLWGGN